MYPLPPQDLVYASTPRLFFTIVDPRSACALIKVWIIGVFLHPFFVPSSFSKFFSYCSAKREKASQKCRTRRVSFWSNAWEFVILLCTAMYVRWSCESKCLGWPVKNYYLWTLLIISSELHIGYHKGSWMGGDDVETPSTEVQWHPVLRFGLRCNTRKNWRYLVANVFGNKEF